MAVIPAAGTLPWRRNGCLEVLLVHRLKYNDWSWPKGKLDTGESWPAAARRETREETGLDVRLGRALPSTSYTVLDGDGQPATKEVRYWAAQVAGGTGELLNEIDEVRWLDVAAAGDRLDYAHDRDQLRALVRADTAGHLETWPLCIVRHATARSRSSWSSADPLRPLDTGGVARSHQVAAILGAFGVTRLVTSDSLRCVQTLSPYAAAAGLPLQLRNSLSEEGFGKDKRKARRQVDRVIERGEATAVCSHGPVLPSLVGRLLRHSARVPLEPDAVGADIPVPAETTAGRTTQRERTVAQAFTNVTNHGLAKGEVLVCHLVGVGAAARIVSMERHRPE